MRIAAIATRIPTGLAALTITILIVSRVPAVAQSAVDPHDAQPERPTVATHAGTVATGWAELEAGVERDTYPGDLVGGVVPILLKVGLRPRMQLGIQGFAIDAPDGGNGPGDLSLGLKWRLVEHAPLLGDFAVLPSIKLPTGSVARGTGTGTTDTGLVLISSHDLHGVAMDLNAGYTHRSGNGAIAPRHAAVWTASFGGSAVGRLGWCAEMFGFPAIGANGGESLVGVLAGPTYAVQRWFVVDAGFIAPVRGPQPHAVYAGVTWNMGRLWQ